MRMSRKRTTAFVTSGALDRPTLRSFLGAIDRGGFVRWRGHRWRVVEHQAPATSETQHLFRLEAAPSEQCPDGPEDRAGAGTT